MLVLYLKKIDKKTLKNRTFVSIFISFILFSFHFRVCTGYANGAYIKCSTKFLSAIALIHVSGDFFLPVNVGNVSVPSGFAGFRFMRCAATGHYKFCCNVRPCARSRPSSSVGSVLRLSAANVSAAFLILIS